MEKDNFTTALHEICSKDELRPAYNCIHFINGYAYATDGSMAIKQSLEYHSILAPENLNGNAIHRESYKEIMKFDFAEATDEGIKCTDTDGRTAFFEYFNLENQKPLNFEAIIDNFSAKGVDFIGFSAEKIYKMKKAFHTLDGFLKFDFAGIDKAMRITAIGLDNQVGIIMPAILNSTMF